MEFLNLSLHGIETIIFLWYNTVTLDILKETNEFLPLSECTFLADKGYNVKAIYNTVRDVYNGDCFIPLNKRSTKNPKNSATAM